MAKILIVGCGKIGQPLAHQLIGDGHQVTGLRRTLAESKDSEISWLRLDICDPESVALLPVDFAMLIIILTPLDRSEQGYRSIYQHGLRNLLQHFTENGRHPACIFVSATSVFGQQHGEWVDEESPTAPGGYNGKSLLEAERLVKSFSESPLIVRFSGIYGEQRTRLLKQLERPLEIQQAPPVFTNRIHQQDCVNVLYHFATRQLKQCSLHSVYVATDHDCATKFEMMSWLATRAGLIVPTPITNPPGSTQNKRCSNRRLLESGYRFRYRSYRDGYDSMLPS